MLLLAYQYVEYNFQKSQQYGKVIFESFVFYIICNMLHARLCIKQISSDVCVEVNLFLLKTITLYGKNDKDRSQTEMLR